MDKLKRIGIALGIGTCIAVTSIAAGNVVSGKPITQIEINKNYSNEKSDLSKKSEIKTKDNSTSKKSKNTKGGCGLSCAACSNKCF